MDRKTKLLLGLCLVISTLAYAAGYLTARPDDIACFEYEHLGPRHESGKSRVDLGDGLELSESIQCENGVVRSRNGEVTRNGETLLEYSFLPELELACRRYYYNGKDVAFESVSMDGRLESLILTDADGNIAEVFERQENGTILPVGCEQLEKIKNGEKLIEETFTPIADAAKKGNADEQEVRELVEDAVRKRDEFAEQSSRKKEE